MASRVHLIMMSPERGGANQRSIMRINEQGSRPAHHPDRESVKRDEILPLEY